MQRVIMFAFAAAMFVGSQLTAEDDRPSPGQQLQFNLCVFEGDLAEAGSHKVLTEPCLVTFEKHPISFVSGGEIAVSDGANGVQLVPVGRIVIMPGTIEGRKIRVDITMSNTTIEKGNENRLQLHTESTRTITTVALDEVVKLRWGKPNADKQTWVKLSVGEVKP